MRTQPHEEMAARHGDKTGLIAEVKSIEAGHYDEYLQMILCEYGVQLSPKGTTIIETPEQSFPLIEFVEAAEQGSKKSLQSAATTVKPQDDDDEEPRLEIDESRLSEQDTAGPSSKSSTDEPTRKRKKYEISEPLQDPELEKKRQNAILAKRHREKQKRQMETQDETIRKQKHIISQCCKVFRRTQSDIMKLQVKLELSEKTVKKLETKIRQKELESRNLSEKLTLMRGHLDIIASSLDNENPARRLLLSLLERTSRQQQSHETTSKSTD